MPGDGMAHYQLSLCGIGALRYLSSVGFSSQVLTAQSSTSSDLCCFICE